MNPILEKIPQTNLLVRYPSFREYHLENTIDEMNKENLRGANSIEMASWLYSISEKPEEFDNTIRKNDVWFEYVGEDFLEFRGQLLLPESKEKSLAEIYNGVIIDHNPKIVNGNLFMDKKSLISRLHENDPTVKFVPYGFKKGSQTILEFEKNPYIIARYGEEGAQKMAKVASMKLNAHSRHFNKDPIVFDNLIDNTYNNDTKISRIRINQNWVDGYPFGDDPKMRYLWIDQIRLENGYHGAPFQVLGISNNSK